MKTILLILIAFFITPAFAEPLPAAALANMVAQAGAVMDDGLCAVANDAKDYGNQTVQFLVGMKLVSVLRNDYNFFRTGYLPGTRHKWLMQDRIEDSCADADGAQCRVARLLWSQQPPAERPPGPGVRSRN